MQVRIIKAEESSENEKEKRTDRGMINDDER